MYFTTQAKGSKSISFLTRKERNGLSTLCLRRWIMPGFSYFVVSFFFRGNIFPDILALIFSSERIETVLTRSPGCAGWSAK